MNCPNCGAALDWLLQATRMRDCGACGSTVVLDGGALRTAGRRGEMLDAPSLFALGAWTRFDGERLLPVGHARFSYGPGWWDEFWCDDDQGRMVWVSVDEGDVAVEIGFAPREHLRPAAQGGPPPFAETGPTLGQEVLFDGALFRAVEVDEAECVAVRGEFPEELSVGERHRYAVFSGPESGLLTAESWRDGAAWRTDWTVGRWLDPWSAVRERAG